MTFDITKLDPPQYIQDLEYEAILAEWVADFHARDPSYGDFLESDPVYKLLQAGAARERTLIHKINQRALATLLAYAEDEALDHLGAFYRCYRLVLDPGDPLAIPPVPPTKESNEAYRLRIQESPEALSVAGPEGAYRSLARAASGDIADVSVESPNPCDITITVLAKEGDGTAAAPLLEAVGAAVTPKLARPLGDNVTVQSATILSYAIEATLTIAPDADQALVLAQAQAAAAAYRDRNRKVGNPATKEGYITRAGIIAALTVSGVIDVNLTEPAANVEPTISQAGHCTGITVTAGS